MDAGSIDLIAAWQPVVNRIRIQLAVWFSYLLVAALALSTILTAARRLAGGLDQPLSPASMTLAAALAALFAAGARFSSPLAASANRAARCTVRWLPPILLVIFVAALSVHGTSTAALAIAWIIVAAEELLAWHRFRPIAAVNPSPLDKPHEPAPPLAVSRVAAPSLPIQSATLSPEIRQQQTRAHLPSGVDRLNVWLQMPLALGERNATAHVAFCPPFLESPKISLRQTAGPAGRIRAVQILPHGVRLEMKLDFSPRQPQRVSVEFVAEARGE